MNIIDNNFHQKITHKHVVPFSTSDFKPILTKRVIIAKKGLDFVYKTSNLILEQKINNLSKNTKNVYKDVKLKLNILISLNFPSNENKFLLNSKKVFLAGKGDKSASNNFHLHQWRISRFIDNLLQLPKLNQFSLIKTQKIVEINKNQEKLSNKQNFIFNQLLKQRNKQNETRIFFNSAPVKRVIHSNIRELKIKKNEFEREFMNKNHLSVIKTQFKPKLYHKIDSFTNSIGKISTHILNFEDEKIDLNEFNVEKRYTNFHYPEIEHIKSHSTEIIKEKVIEKVEESTPSPENAALPDIDLNILTDRVYSALEQKIKIERERRGLFG